MCLLLTVTRCLFSYVRLLEGMLIVSCFIPFWEQLWLAALRTSHGCWPLVENLVADLPRFWLDSLCCFEIDLFQLVFFFFATCVRISAMKYHWDYKQMMTMKSPICFGRCSGSHFPTTIDNQTSTIKTQWSEEWCNHRGAWPPHGWSSAARKITQWRPPI